MVWSGVDWDRTIACRAALMMQNNNKYYAEQCCSAWWWPRERDGVLQSTHEEAQEGPLQWMVVMPR